MLAPTSCGYVCSERMHRLQTAVAATEAKLTLLRKELQNLQLAMQAADAVCADDEAHELRTALRSQLQASIAQLERQHQITSDRLSFYEKMACPAAAPAGAALVVAHQHRATTIMDAGQALAMSQLDIGPVMD